MAPQCGMEAHPKVPCEDIELYEVHIKEHDSDGFPKYPETAKEGIQRSVINFYLQNSYGWYKQEH